MDLKQSIRQGIAYDDSRRSVPGEHMLTVLAGSALALHALRNTGHLRGTLQALAAGALLMRAASGTDGLRRWSGAASRRPGNITADDLAADLDLAA
ncbi:MAG: hypothetical protein JWQ88_1691 [Rhodoferax sp.]|nr:hypothetical protein [Rhodoferax sp.]